jgi:predicted thioredoxin/glutaredoxin
MPGKDNHRISEGHHVRLFVSSDCELCDQASAFLEQWSENHLEVKTEIVSVLSAPEEVVRLQIFYTPALIVDGEVIVKQELSVEQIAELLPA